MSYHPRIYSTSITILDVGAGDIIDIAFGGENFEELFVLTKTDIMRVLGK